MTNIVVANLAKAKFFRCPPLYQYNYGMVLRITGIDLPTAYEVDFSNDIGGTSITQIGNADGVTIPAQFFQPGQAIYCWLRVHPTTDSGITTATIVIPISPRATITDEEPTPEEQSAIDEAIAALNDAVDKAEDAVEHYPTITGGVWYVWDVDAGEYVSTGVPAQGAQGNPGDDGYSPTASVTKTGNTATITITDKSGTSTAQVSDGAKGDPGTPGAPGADGFSPVATVTQTQTGATISITDKTGTTTATVSNGAKGDHGDDYVLTAADKAEIAQQAAAEIIIPTAATTAEVKGGTISTHFIAPSVQDSSVFYALAKTAGADMASSSNPVGTYTDAAKVAIQKMLGIYQAPWELIREDTVTNATEADINITVDGNGESFELTDVYLQVWTPQQETQASIGDYGTVRNYYNDSNYITSQMGTWTQAASASDRFGQVLLTNENGAIKNIVTNNATKYSSVNLVGRTNVIDNDALMKIGTFTFTKSVIKKVTGTLKYKLYGRRKWN